MFLVSPDAVRLDGELRFASAQASDMLAHDGIAAFQQMTAASDDDEFAQDALF